MSNDNPPLDADVLTMLRRLSPPGGPDVLADVLRLFQEDMPVRLAALEAAVGGGDLRLVQRTAHAIKGGAGNIGARRLFTACGRLEQSARSGQLEELHAAMMHVTHESTRVLDAIRVLLT